MVGVPALQPPRSDPDPVSPAGKLTRHQDQGSVFTRRQHPAHLPMNLGPNRFSEHVLELAPQRVHLRVG